MTLTEQLSDARSNEVAFRVNIENAGTEPVHLLALTPRLPEGVALIEVKDFSAELDKVRHERLCTDLTEILDRRLTLNSAEHRQAITEAMYLVMKDIFTRPRTLLAIYGKLLFVGTKGSGKLIVSKIYHRLGVLSYKISDSSDAKVAMAKWFTNPSDVLDALFTAKAEQLERLERDMGADEAAKALAVIEPDSFAATTYVLQFPRSYLNPRKFSFTVEATISAGEDKPTQLRAVSTTITVSPKPYVLSVVAVLAALLGTSIRFSLPSTQEQPIGTYFSSLMRYLFTSPGLTAAVMALVVFNVYEFLEIGRKITMGVGWRSALLVGALCGLFSDRMIKALQVLVGN
ncbi:hypothetical protein [Mesorhizobium sp.]|uniref:hypothetical protein n=1 Tax=Mesorhizobium sp. TaxID=1871066 RepID=UPI000FD47101|nr:hypothetical protein [Mesorhizobium sp.]RVC63981.1 hypothetical protein EN779_03280 [Mesorhizobium sp. M4B.F.Ca.ET.088.02.2.1]RWF32436.1 MAG: hypothetical protein EOS45_06885 [Mesorhizobium sp.]